MMIMEGVVLILGFNCRSGNAFVETLFVVTVLLVFALLAVFGSRLLNDFNSEIQGDDLVSNSTKTEIGEMNEWHPKVFDNLVLTVFVLLWIGAGVASFMVRSHPVFFAIMLVLLVFAFIFLAVLSNVFVEVVSGGELEVTSESFPNTTFLMENLVLVGVVVSSTVLILMFTSSGGGL